MLEGWGVSGDDQLELLAVSGGIQHTDTLELAEFRGVDDTLEVPLRFRMASKRHFPLAEQLQPGDALGLERDRANADPLATWVVLRAGEPVGYIPRQYTRLVTRLLDAGSQLKAEVLRQLPVARDGSRWLLALSRAAVSSA